MDNKIISKVQNLLELAYDAPNDEEGQTALLMAQKLMVKHNLSISDIKTSQKNDNIGETVGHWEYRLPSSVIILMLNFAVKCMKGQSYI